MVPLGKQHSTPHEVVMESNEQTVAASEPDSRRDLDEWASRQTCPECGIPRLEVEWELQAEPSEARTTQDVIDTIVTRKAPVLTCGCGFRKDSGPDYPFATDQATRDGVEPYRDGKVHIMSEKCSTCVFRPGDPMNLRPGRLKELTDHVQETGVPFSCHQTLPYASKVHTEHYGGAALCHGAVESYGDQSIPMRMARALDAVVEVEPYRDEE